MKSKYKSYKINTVLKKKLICILGFFILFCCSNIAMAQIKRYEITGGYVYNFAKNINWPEEEDFNTFNIILISENTEIINEFRNMAVKLQIKNKPISLIVLKEPTSVVSNAQLIFITNEKSSFFLDVFDNIEGNPILLISENYDDKRFVMINLYDTPDKKMLFEINNANILNQKLTINDEILLLGGTEIDVAKLYLKSQQSLRSIQNQLDNNNEELNALKTQIIISNKEIVKQQDQLNQQSSLIESQQNTHTELQAKINHQVTTIDEQQYLLLKERDSLQLLTLRLYENKKRLSEQHKEIEDGKHFLEIQKEEISRIDKEIGQKNKILEEQETTIIRQRQIMYMFVAIIFLIIILVIVVFRAYRNNKRKNIQLNNQKIKIENINEELKALNQKIDNRNTALRKKSAELHLANTGLKEGDRLKSVFIANMSHELRTPLNSIIGFTGMVLMGLAGDINEEQKKQLTMVKSSAHHLLNLINDILDISKIEAGKTELFPEEFFIDVVIQEVVDTVTPMASKKGIELLKETPDITLVFHDKKRIKQILMNLVGNAVKFTDRGSVKIVSEVSNKKHLVVSVIDTGTGIKKRDISKLFGMFNQVDMSSTKKHEGTGLGLYLSKKMVTMLNGDISVKSEYGKGSEFAITLPLKYKENK